MGSTAPSFGEVLLRLRSAAGFSHLTLAERAGLSRNGISDLERDVRQAPRLETVRLLADALALDEDDRRALLAAARPDLYPEFPPEADPLAPAPLPTPLTRLIGRETELTDLRAKLQDLDVRLLTLTGTGGVGKTRLAIALAADLRDDFAGGVCFVDLSPLTDPALVIPTIASSLGVREVVGHDLLSTLMKVLGDRQLLLLLDNVERVVAAAPEIATILAGCPRVTVLATSREPLHVHGEYMFPIGPLLVPCEDHQFGAGELAKVPAIVLFVERARAVQPDFALSPDSAPAVAEICRRLDGLPLAIELAAARVRLLSPEILLTRLEHRLPLLTGGPRDRPARLRTMRDAIGWSYDLLSPEEARLFLHLAVFAGGFTLDAAEAIGVGMDRDRGSADSVIDLVTSLADKNLLQVACRLLEPRFRMLETVREFALEELAAIGEAEAAAERHAAWCTELARSIRQSGQLSRRGGLALLEAEHPNFRAALHWLLARGKTDEALHLMGQLAEFWLRHGHYREALAWIDQGLAAGREASVARAEALVGISLLLWGVDLKQAEDALAQADVAAHHAADVGAIAYVRLHQGYVALHQANFALALVRGAEALEHCETIPQGFACNGALWLLARVALDCGENDRAASLYQRLLASAQAGGDEISIATAQQGLAVLAQRRGDVAQALFSFAEAATVCRSFGDQVHTSLCLDGAATSIAATRPEAAARLLAASAALRRSVDALSRLAPPDLEGHEEAFAVVRAALTRDRFTMAWEEGSGLSADAAIAQLIDLARSANSQAQRDQQPNGMEAEKHQEALHGF